MPKGLKTILRTLGVIFDGLQFVEFVCYAIMLMFSIFGL